jgi:UDP-GlcNAc3NAcA epimerase
MRICSIVGARPQFVKLAALCRALGRRPDRDNWTHTIIHTGQHYDTSLSGVFFEELLIPLPDHHLGVGSGSHGCQTGEMLKLIEPILAREHPDWVLLYGDTNSTLAGALAAAKMGLPVAHIEAGLRSHRRSMAEEINRIVADHLSHLLCCPTSLAIENLSKEGLRDRALLTGDLMYDAVIAYRDLASKRESLIAKNWRPGEFAIATVHRAENTDDECRLRAIVHALEGVAGTICPVLWPVHPRARKRLLEIDALPSAVTLIDPVSYLEMLLLESRARFILTDSGGVQKEAFFLHVPCVTLRDETEWEETLEDDCNVLAGCDRESVFRAICASEHAGPWKPLFGDGDAGSIILRALAASKVSPITGRIRVQEAALKTPSFKQAS